MAIITWDDSLKIGINAIDIQHQKLFWHINNFYDNLNNKNSKESLSELLKALQNYTLYHFNTEEKLMHQYKYSGLNDHKNEHQKFIDTVNSYLERFNTGKLVLSIEITNYLKEWITDHIKVNDKKYGEFLIKVVGKKTFNFI
jgi:hemerythrin-like metal-binding protein